MGVISPNAGFRVRLPAALEARHLVFDLGGGVHRVGSSPDSDAISKWIAHFLERFSVQKGVHPRGMTAGVQARLRAYARPGNGRQLERELHRLVLAATLLGLSRNGLANTLNRFALRPSWTRSGVATGS